MVFREFDIVEETDAFLVVNKPAGLLVHPTRLDGKWTMWDGLKGLLAYEIVNGAQIGIVNRLDRETSGVVLIAKSLDAARELNRLMKGHLIRKGYLALCFGWAEKDYFVVEEPIRRVGEVKESRVWLKRGTGLGGQEAVTEFWVLQRFCNPLGEAFSLVLAMPKTGRTHQIRVHLAHHGLPVVGDKLYARGEEWYLRFVEGGWTEEMEGALRMRRQALHSFGIEFVLGGKLHQIQCGLPADMVAFLCGNGGENRFSITPPWNQSVLA